MQTLLRKEYIVWHWQFATHCEHAPQDTRTPGRSPRTPGHQDTRKAATDTRTPGRLHDIKKAVRTPGHQEATLGHQDIREPSRTLSQA